MSDSSIDGLYADYVSLRIAAAVAAMLALGLFGCSSPSSERAGTPTPGEGCQEEGQRNGDYVCEDGVWVLDEQDAGLDADCDPESHEQFCERHGVECGSFTAEDNCGATRTVHCSEIDGYECEAPAECAYADDSEDLDTNQCQCPPLDGDDPEAAICDYAHAECDTVDAASLCENWSDYGEVDCGTCPDEDCGSEIDNVCGCPCEIDETCYADGETSADNECLICDPERDTESFSEAEDGTACGNGGVCDGAQCVCEQDATQCGDQCVDLDSSRDHCGECDNSCGDAEVCDGGECVAGCPDGESTCNGECVDQQTNENHCGECNNECTTDVENAESTCDGGECVEQCVDDSETICDGTCTNTDGDDQNCGECGEECTTDITGAEAYCDGGDCIVECTNPELSPCGDFCTDTDYDTDHCGECGNDCDTGQVCDEGTCAGVGSECEDDGDCGNFMQCCDGQCQPNGQLCTGG